ncbi:hypothetical protein TGRUB_434400 [Toxoplasma gondii RUB]|uniref:Uncharacterized protein n=1 Tax=Toxoplasma gondii RUB TaxID=935652 RepID=A0A086LIV2_TOXGO|nr:hypothetical protein TGRUB_434400 [Toxoplasma gondii RUB]
MSSSLSLRREQREADFPERRPMFCLTRARDARECLVTCRRDACSFVDGEERGKAEKQRHKCVVLLSSPCMRSTLCAPLCGIPCFHFRFPPYIVLCRLRPVYLLAVISFSPGKVRFCGPFKCMECVCLESERTTKTWKGLSFRANLQANSFCGVCTPFERLVSTL